MSHIWNADNSDGKYTNPILYADYSDPDAIRVENDYYMVASSFCNSPGLPILHSRDLINWEVINYVLKVLPCERYAKPIHGCGVWAPSIRYHNGVYYVCFPMPDEGIFMCTSTDPYKEWSEPVNIRPGSGWIDPCPFWDDDGKAYLVAGVAKSRIGYKSVLHIVEMRPDGMGLIGDEIKVFDGNENDQNTIEGPKLYKKDEWYYIFAPAGGVKQGWQTVLRSRNIYGPYEYRVVLSQGNTNINGPHQGAWVDTVTGEDWFIHFQDVYCAGRIIHLQPMSWVDGWPIIGEYAEGELCGHPVSIYRKPLVRADKSIKSSTIDKTDIATLPDNATKSNHILEPATTDYFTENTLGLQWQWNANYDKKWYSLQHNINSLEKNKCKNNKCEDNICENKNPNNGLKLFAVEKQGPYGDAPNLLLQKWPAPEFACITELDISTLHPGDEAGVISMGMEYGLITFKRELVTNSIQIFSVRGKQIFNSILVEKTLEDKETISTLPADCSTIYVKYLVEQTGKQSLSESEKDFPLETVTISYSVDGREYKNALCMTAIPGRWVGVKNGVFCLSDCDSSDGFVTVKSVVYSKIYHNPVRRGFYPDPSVVRVGEDYYMVNSTFQYFPAIIISHSKDMIHWETIGHAITNSEYLDLNDIRDSHGIWAPDIEYVDGKYIIMATLRLNGDGQRDNNVLRRQLIVWSEKPKGPYSKPIWLEVDNIDPSLFVDDDGSKYMLISPGINLLPLSEDCSEITGDEIAVWEGTGERCPEGPHIIKRGKYYYAILAEGGTGYGHGINVGRSTNLFGPYEPSPYNPLLRQFDPNAQLQRCGHGKLIEDQNGNWWVYYLCGRPNEGKYTTIGRETALEPVRWLEDDWFIINDQQGPSTVNLAPDLKSFVVTDKNTDKSFLTDFEFDKNTETSFMTDFDSNQLSKEWQFVRNPKPGDISLDERKGWLRIWTNNGQLSEIKARNTLLKRETELSYTAVTKLDFYPSRNGEQAGLTCYYSTATYVRFSLCFEQGRKLQLVINRNYGEEIVATIDNIKEQAIYMKVVVNKLCRSFHYSYDGNTWKEAVTLNNCIYLCDEGVPNDPKRHTGTLVGIYANNGGCGSRIPADFDFFYYS